MNKKIMTVWGIIILLICSFLIILGNIGTDYNLYKLEKSIKISARKYLNDKGVYPKLNKSQIVYVSELLDNKYIESNDDIDNYCIQKVEITNNIIKDNFKVYIKCESELKSS